LYKLLEVFNQIQEQSNSDFFQNQTNANSVYQEFSSLTDKLISEFNDENEFMELILIIEEFYRKYVYFSKDVTNFDECEIAALFSDVPESNQTKIYEFGYSNIIFNNQEYSNSVRIFLNLLFNTIDNSDSVWETEWLISNINDWNSFALSNNFLTYINPFSSL